MRADFYDPDDVCDNRLVRDQVVSDGDMVGVYYEGGDGSEILCEMPTDLADSFVSFWNETMEVFDGLEDDINYKQRSLNQAARRIDELEDKLADKL